MAGMKVHADILINHLKMLQIGTFGKLIAAFHIHIIHQNICIALIEFKHSGTLNRIGSLL
ncbi:hypothetical protein D3C85_1032230 [compost metagenome]